MTVEARTFRGPVWWWVAGIGLVAVAVVGALTEVMVGVVIGVGVLGSLFLVLAARARVDLSPDGVVVRPNGFRTFSSPWADIRRGRGHRLELGGRSVTVPPLPGEPLRHILDELEDRGMPRPPDQPSSAERRFGRRRTIA